MWYSDGACLSDLIKFVYVYCVAIIGFNININVRLSYIFSRYNKINGLCCID